MNHKSRKLIVTGLLCVHFGGYALGSAPVLAVRKGETIQRADSDADENKRQLFQLLDRPGFPLVRIGILSENTENRKKLAVTTQLHIFDPIDVGTSETCRFDLRLAFDLPPAAAPEQRYAVGILGDAQWAASEHDDTQGNLSIRSLPSPWLIKNSRCEMKVNLAFPPSSGDKDFQVILFSPGKDSVCRIAQCKANVVPGGVSNRSSDPFTVALASPYDSFFGGAGPLTVDALFQKAKSITDAPYFYRAETEWYGNGSPLHTALLYRINESLTLSNADTLLRAYITLGLQGRISPEWIHRVWLLFLSISPYDADGFRALVRDGNVVKITQFMRDRIGDILGHHRGPIMGPDVVRAVLDRQQEELRQWRRERFEPLMRGILQKKRCATCSAKTLSSSSSRTVKLLWSVFWLH
jgi:hypothetical protein